MSCKDCLCKVNEENDTIEFYISEEERLLFQRYLFELEGLKALAVQFTSDSPFKPDKDRYNEILQSYLEAFIRYNVLFTEVINIYVDKDTIKNRKYETSIDFRLNKINIILK